MIRALSLAALVSAGAALPAMAGDDAASSAADTAAFTAQLSVQANANQARNILLARGYSQVSDLTRGEDGRWTGTAVKDGKTIFVAVEMPPKPVSATN